MASINLLGGEQSQAFNPNTFTQSGLNPQSYQGGTGSGTGSTINLGTMNANNTFTANPNSGAITVPSNGSFSRDDNYINGILSSWAAQPGADPTLTSNPSYYLNRIKQTDGLGPSNLAYWKNMTQPYNAQTNPMGYGRPPENSGTSGNGLGADGFTDPLTKQWQDALTQLAGQLQQAQSVPDLKPVEDYMRQYFQQLQGPAYTPDQMDLIRTQTQDPLTAQRDAQQQQVIQRFAAQGVPPSSGIVQKALIDLNNQYGKLNTTNNATFANNAITVQKQQQQQASQVGTALATLEQQNNAQNESRALQGVNLLFQLPQYADTRLQLANGVIGANQVNPAQLLSLIPGFQNSALSGSQATTTNWSQLAPLLSQLFGTAFTGA